MRKSFFFGFLIAALAVVGCGGAGGDSGGDGNSPVAYAVTSEGRLINFELDTTNDVNLDVPISGLQGGETILGIDFRPETGDLYALGSTGRLYTINTTTGDATIVGSQLATALSGTRFGVDFNPAADRLRVVSDSEQSLRINPDTAVETVDTDLNPTGNVVAVAYNNNVAGATETTLFGIDSASDTLVRIGGTNGNPSPNLGAISTIGILGVDVTSDVGFDITENGTGVFVSSSGISNNNVFVVNLGSGGTSFIGSVPGAEIVAFAIRPQAL